MPHFKNNVHVDNYSFSIVNLKIQQEYDDRVATILVHSDCVLEITSIDLALCFQPLCDPNVVVFRSTAAVACRRFSIEWPRRRFRRRSTEPTSSRASSRELLTRTASQATRRSTQVHGTVVINRTNIKLSTYQVFIFFVFVPTFSATPISSNLLVQIPIFLRKNPHFVVSNITHTRCKYFDPCYARATVVRARFLAAAFSDGSYLAHVNGAYLRHVTFCIVRGPPLFIVSPISESGSRAAAHLPCRRTPASPILAVMK